MADPQIFQFIGHAITGAMDTYVNSTVPGVISHITALAVTMGAIYYAGVGLLISLGRIDGVLSKLLVSAGKFMLIGIIALSAGHYQHWVVDTFHGLESGLTQAFADGQGTEPTSVYQMIDQSVGKGIGLGTDLWNKASDRGITQIGSMISEYIEAVIVYGSTLAIAVPAGAMIIIAKTMLELFLGVGPFFIIMLLWPVTKAFFDRWFAEIMAAIFQIALVATCLAFATKIFSTVVGHMQIDSMAYSPMFDCLRLLAITLVLLSVMYAVWGKAGALGGGLASAAVTLGAIAMRASGFGSMATRAINPTSTRRDLETGMMTTGSRWDHLSAGNTVWNPRYIQHVKRNLGRNWGWMEGGGVKGRK